MNSVHGLCQLAWHRPRASNRRQRPIATPHRIAADMTRSSASPTSVRFRFRLVRASEEAPSGRRHNGTADEKSLQLGSESWDLVDLAAVEQDGARLLLLLQPSQQPPLTITISISKVDPS